MKPAAQSAPASMTEECRPQLLTLAKTLPVDRLPAFLASMDEAHYVALPRLMASASEAAAPPVEDELITIPEAAAMLGLCPGYLYRHKELPFMVTKPGIRARRCSKAGITAWIRENYEDED